MSLQLPVCDWTHDAAVYGHLLGVLGGDDDPAHCGREGTSPEGGKLLENVARVLHNLTSFYCIVCFLCDVYHIANNWDNWDLVMCSNQKKPIRTTFIVLMPVGRGDI